MLPRVVLVLALSLPLSVGAQMSNPVVVAGVPYPDSLSALVDLRVETAPDLRAFFAAPEPGPLAPRQELNLRSAAALVINQEDGQLLYAKNTAVIMPIASITKLMTAVVTLDAGLPLDDPITIAREDVDKLKSTGSRLRVGVTLPRGDMLRLALMASENRAAAALARTYPGGAPAFVEAMNLKAKQLGMRDTRYVDATGLNPNNVSTAVDLALLVNAGCRYPLIRDYSTTESVRLAFRGGRKTRALAFRNSNALVRSSQWEIGLQKTGYIREAGRCLVMQARISARPVIIVLLDSWGKFARIADANRIKHWVEALTAPSEREPGKS